MPVIAPIIAGAGLALLGGLAASARKRKQQQQAGNTQQAGGSSTFDETGGGGQSISSPSPDASSVKAPPGKKFTGRFSTSGLPIFENIPSGGSQVSEGGGPPPGSPEKPTGAAPPTASTPAPAPTPTSPPPPGTTPPVGTTPTSGLPTPASGTPAPTPVTDPNAPLSPSDQALVDAGLPLPPDIPSVSSEFQDDVGTLTDVRVQAEQDRVTAQTDTAERAQDISESIQSGIDTTRGEVAGERAGLTQEQQTFQQDLDTRRQELSTLAGDVRNEFDSIREQFSASVQGAIGDIEGARAQALNGVYQGQAAAMQSAVQGIQGNINTQVAQINGNPNLTAAQKQQMINQVKMTGAMALAPAIGATQLQFNTLAANVNTQFGQILGQIEATGLSGETQLGTAGGQAFLAASNAMNQMSNQILELSESSVLAFSAQQASLIALRNQAENSGNQLLNQVLPETTMPYHDYGDIYAENLENSVSIFKEDIANALDQYGIEATAAQVAIIVGTPSERLFEDALAGFQAGGVPGAILAGVGNVISDFFNPRT